MASVKTQVVTEYIVTLSDQEVRHLLSLINKVLGNAIPTPHDTEIIEGIYNALDTMAESRSL